MVLTRKILLLAVVALTLIICGCEQEMPQPGNVQPKIENPAPQPQAKSEFPEIPDLNKTPVSKPMDNPSTNVAPVPETPPQVETPPPVIEPVEKTIEVKAYFPDDAGINLVAVKRKITYINESDKYLDAVKLLMTKPNETDLTGIFPKGAKINSVKVVNGTAYVDFDNGITKNFVGGSTGEEMLINSVVQTLTEFKEVKQVRFLIDGQEIETLAGHMDLSTPLTRISQ